MAEKFSNYLTDAEAERLALLIEEAGEVLQVAGKILRHGYESSDPTIIAGPTNRRTLQKEIGDLCFAMQLMDESGDVTFSDILHHREAKRKSVKQWLHHQGAA